MSRLDVDDLICRILNSGTPGNSLVTTVKEAELHALCAYARGVFLSQPSLVEVEPPIKICGDTHGQFADVQRLFDRGGFPPLVNYLFLGDYVDRGHQNLECIALFLCYKVKYPGNFFLLRGNHECAAINRVYGFFEECNRRYQSNRLWMAFQDVFCTMPFCGLVAAKILCMHGGLSPKLRSLDQLRQITRPIDPPNPSLHIDLLWADPDAGTKVKYPGNFFLLRGNHECAAINRVYGFFEECNRRYQSNRLWMAFQDVFCTMPFCGLVAAKILCMHGGLSPKLRSLDQLRQITRPIDPPNPSLHIDLLWADPDAGTKGWQSNTRGVSYVFGQDVLQDVLNQLDIDLIARAHQVVQDGYEFFGNKKLVTIFSAPHYCGQFDNAAAMMNVDESLVCSFHIMRPTTKLSKVTARGAA